MATSRNAALCLFLLASFLYAQAPAPAPDVLIFKNGEKLIGHFIRSNGSVVVFKSDSIGELNVAWGSIQELHSARKFVVVGKDVKLAAHPDISIMKQGSMAVSAQTLTLTPDTGAPVTMPIAEAAHILDEATFQQDIHHSPGFSEDWKGAITGGASIVEATQQSRTFTGAISLIRAIPTETWMDARNRTIFNLNVAAGHINQPDTETIKTEIVHGDAERDQYFRGKTVYGFVQAAFDHNFSQGLDLQQSYGGGIGWTAIKEANTTLDLKGSVSYTRQSFQTPASNHNLIGSVFAESLAHKFAKGVQFLQGVSVTPAWNEGHAYAAAANAAVNVPLYKHLSTTTTLLDTFLNDPPPGFKKNSFQLTTGLTYSFR